jgi:hypothetical protein
MTTTKYEKSERVIATTDEIKNRWSLAVAYWRGKEILETFSVGNTKKEALRNWFFQYYGGKIPEGASLPCERDTIFVSWVKFVKA